MFSLRILPAVLITAAGLVLAQEPTDKPSDQDRERRTERSRESGESSSRDSRIDLSPPKDDAKNHPNSSIPSENDIEAGDVQEFHPWDPHKAVKDIEVGDFYFKKKNYRAALDRYREALEYKPNDAVANFRLGQCLEKMNQPEEARLHYEEYLKILPHGPLAEEAQKQLQKIRSDGKKE
jgi:tetratricopeptide (TPR) repeat protein